MSATIDKTTHGKAVIQMNGAVYGFTADARSQLFAQMLADYINSLEDENKKLRDTIEAADSLVSSYDGKDLAGWEVELYKRRRAETSMPPFQCCATCTAFEQFDSEPAEYGLCGHRGDEDPGCMHRHAGTDCDSHEFTRKTET